MPDAPWKADERWLAERRGTKRIGPVGKGGPDVVDERLIWQCKMRDKKHFPNYLTEWMDEHLEFLDVTRCGALYFRRKGMKRTKGYVVMTYEQFEEYERRLQDV